MEKKVHWILNGCICLGLLSCRETFDTQPIRVDSEMAPYLLRFEKEAARRGVNISQQLKEIDVAFGTVANDGIYGQCTRSTKQRKRILINRVQWRKDEDLAHERIVFHELGHCVLDLPHSNQAFSNGTCQSIMNGTENGFSCAQNYSYRTRTYYLDQLFGKETAAPSWTTFPFLNDFFNTTLQAVVTNEHGSPLSGVSGRLVNQADTTFQVLLPATTGPAAGGQTLNLTSTFDGKLIPDGTYAVEFRKKGFETIRKTIEYTGQGRILLEAVQMRFTDRCLGSLKAAFEVQGTEIGLGQNATQAGVEVSLQNVCTQPVTGLTYRAYLAQGGVLNVVREGLLSATSQEVELRFGKESHTSLRPGNAVLIIVIQSTEQAELFVFRKNVRLVA
ncbi:carboxypeptidase-like regulatory domain-containing protein [Telluribacter sp.]|jgi:hypothetical protein|uniref:carboxypeptidase-like regulatory domain-containing protein n=1 Tax=Telluribacter sp. TaxID=1978767 RepID=UPI002E0EB55A|nr:carboxypeptidase-like regulatory domain-containing protein [Telluribacter sp.]